MLSADKGSGPRQSASFPGGINVMPAKPRAAQIAASGFPAMLTFASRPTSAAMRFRSSAIFSLGAEQLFAARNIENNRAEKIGFASVFGILRYAAKSSTHNRARPHVP